MPLSPTTPTVPLPRWLQLCLPLTKGAEGCELAAYPDPATGAEPWTIGYGATGPNIGPGTVWTQDQADADLLRRLTNVNMDVTRAVRVRITDGQRAALVDFAYNLGTHALLGSTLLRKLNAGDYAGAAAEFPKWVHAAGKVMPGLVARRADEQSLFLTGGS